MGKPSVCSSLVVKQSVAEYSCCLQYLMQPNVVSDVEGIIRKALTFERTDFQKPRAKIDAQLMGESMIQSGNHGLRSPCGNLSRNPLIDSTGRGWSLTLSQSSRDAEMIVSILLPSIPTNEFFQDSPGRENLQRMDGNIQIQRRCANFIHQFIGIRSISSTIHRYWFFFLDRLRRAMRKNGVPDDDQTIRALDGLDQV